MPSRSVLCDAFVFDMPIRQDVNVDTLAADLTMKFNMKDISCSYIFNMFLQDDTLTKKYHSNVKILI